MTATPTIESTCETFVVSGSWRLSGLFIGVFFLVLSILAIPEYRESPDDYYTPIQNVAGFMVIVYSVIYTWRFKVVLEGMHLTRRALGTREIQLSDVNLIRLEGLGKIVIRTPQQKIVLFTGIENRDRLVRLIVSRIRDLPNLQITGDKDKIDEYFS